MLEANPSPSSRELSIYKGPQESELIEKIEPVLEGLGYGLRDLEILGSAANPLVRVTLEAVSGAPEIGIEDCSRAHHVLGPLFDVWDPFPGAYTLELSSPGEKPNLRLGRHFREAVGERIQFQSTEPLPMPPPSLPRRNWEGVLKELRESEGLVVLVDSYGEHVVPLEKIRAATWLREWSPSGAAKDAGATGGPDKRGSKKKSKE